MTFSQEIKNELCGVKLHCTSCKKALVYGMLMFSRGIRETGITLNIENRAVVEYFTANLIDLTGVIVTVTNPDLRERTKRPLFTISVEDRQDTAQIIEYFFGDITKKHLIENWVFERECCKNAFLRGVYLICGTMLNPEKEYHLEFSVSSCRLCGQLLPLLSEAGLSFKQTQRLSQYVLYIKESNRIEDTLTYLGAVKASLKLMNLKIEKELRNTANRVTNCETANISKTVNASMEQIGKIQRIRDHVGLESLPEELQDVAILRLMNPEASLRELSELTGNRIGRSKLNRLLKKLADIAEEM